MTPEVGAGSLPEGSRDELPEAWLEAGFGSGSRGSADQDSSVLRWAWQETGAVRSVLLRDEVNDGPPVIAGSAEDKDAGHSFGRYQVIGEIAAGGMGVILKGRDVELGRDVAMKVLRRDNEKNAAMVRRFVEEAQIGGQLQHPGVVPVYEMGLAGGKRPYFTMKLVKGETLAAQLRRRKSPDDERHRLLQVFLQVCHTMAYAHARGVIHRDLKPSNVMVGAFGEVQVVDWGLAKVMARREAADDRPKGEPPPDRTVVATVRSGTPEFASQAGSVLGTYAYMAPEQARGEIDGLDERADVFALGAVLCEILTGQPPYGSASPEVVYGLAMAGWLEGAWTRIDACGADEELRSLVRRCLNPEPAGRPANAEVVAAEIQAHLASVAERVRRSEVEAAEARAHAEEAQARAAQERRARRLGLALAAVIVLVVGIGAGAYLWLDNARRSRLEDIERRVNVALEESARLMGQARGAAGPDVAAWQRALDAARRAQEVALAGAATQDIATRVERVWSAVNEELERAQALAAQRDKDQKMKERLEAIRLVAAEGWDWNRQAAQFAQAFHDYGIDVPGLPPEEAVRRIRESSLSLILPEALDQWAKALALGGRPAGTATRSKLSEIAQGADDDARRREIRSAKNAGDLDALRRLAASCSPADLSAAGAGYLADALVASGGAGTAVEVLQAAQRAHPQDFWVNHELAQCLTMLKPPRWTEAIRHYTAALAVRPRSVGAWDNLGIALRRTGAVAEAIDAFRRGIDCKPDDPITYVNLGSLLSEDQEDPAGALEVLHKAIAIDASYGLAWMYAGNAYRQLGDRAKAEEAYRTAIGHCPGNDQPHVNLGCLLLKDGRIDEALDEFERGRSLNPANPLAWNNIGLVLCDFRKDYDRAIEAFQEAIKRDPDNPSFPVNLGIALWNSGDEEAAAAAFRESILRAATYRWPDSGGDRPGILPFRNLALILRGKKRWDEADQVLAEALARHPEEARTGYLIRELFTDRDDASEAIARLRRGARTDPSTLRTLHLALALHGVGDLEGALACLAETIGRSGADWRLHLARGEILLALGRVDEASACFEECNRLRPVSFAWHGLGVVARRRGDDLAALRAFQKSVGIDREFDRGHFDLGVTLASLGDYEGALHAFRTSVDISPRWAPALRNLAWTLDRLGLLEESAATWRRLLAVDRSDCGDLAQLGNVLHAAGDLPGAAQAFREVSARDGESADAWIDLGFVLRDAGKFREASEALRTGHQLGIRDPDWKHPSLEWVEECERMVAQDENLTRINAADPGPESLADRVAAARACQAQGRFAAASRHWETALAMEPSLGDDRSRAFRFSAARAAALAGSGEGGDAGELTVAMRAHWRRRAADWLRTDAETWTTSAPEADRKARYGVVRALRIRKLHPDLRGIRDSGILVTLPEDEQRNLRAFWSWIDEQIQEKRPPRIEIPTGGR